tara:strand:+ start:9 stop:572 length:564 start_codon:yes stop_codon:yes gene_type:complete
MDKLTSELRDHAKEKDLRIAEHEVDDVLTYALFPQIGLKFLENRDNPDAFEPVPSADEAAVQPSETKPAAGKGKVEAYSVKVDGQIFNVEVGPKGTVSAENVQQQNADAAPKQTSGDAEDVAAPLAGNVFKVIVKPGQQVSEGDVLIVLEAMKMETDIKADRAGTVAEVYAKEGDSVAVGDALLSLE